jgi:hypothetical protein
MTSDEINEYAIKYRGIMLNGIIRIERMMDLYLCQYFTPIEHKQDELLNMIFGTLRITFENKRSLLDYLIKKDLVDIATEWPTLTKDMQALNSKRTILAHYLLDASKEAQELPEGTVRFYKFMNNMDFETLGAAEFRSIEVTLNKMYIYIVEHMSGVLPLSDSATVHGSEPS